MGMGHVRLRNGIPIERWNATKCELKVQLTETTSSNAGLGREFTSSLKANIQISSSSVKVQEDGLRSNYSIGSLPKWGIPI